MRVLLSLIAVLLALTACTQHGINDAIAKSNSIIVACRTKLDTGELKTFSAVAKCREMPVIEAYKDAGYPYVDLIRIVMAAGDAAAERIDRGEVGEAETKLELAELMRRVAAEEQRRLLEARQGKAVPRDAATQLLQGLPALQATNRPGPGVSCLQMAAAAHCQ